MPHQEIRVAPQALEAFTRIVFTQAGLPPKDAAVESEVLVWANLCGVDSHGVLRIPWYLDNIDIGLFHDVAEFKAQVDETIDQLKALPTADGFSSILMPGEPEQRTLAERSQHCIPLPPGTVERLRAAAQRFGLPLPDSLV